jgi:beta-glucosidase
MENFNKTKKLFPKDFMWGGSTASHQVEGKTINQWSVWELANATSLAKSAKKRLGNLPIWSEIQKEAEDPNNYVSGTGVQHYERYEEDFDILKEINLDSLRFGIEWSRIEPREGHWDESEVEHYHKYIDAMKARDIKPVLNIWHWTMPTWFTDKGGLLYHRNFKYFDRYVAKIAKEFGGDLEYIITLNEPNVYTNAGYFIGEWPPQQKSGFSFLKVYWNLTRLHKRAYKILKRENPKLQIGIAAQLANIQAKRPHNFLDGIVTKIMRYGWNWWFLIRIRRQSDFVGINYYFTDYYTGMLRKENPTVPLNDLGWYMEPEGLYPLLLRTWARYKKPIIVTENGVADMYDENRRWWIEETIVAMSRALSEGVVIKGYFHWSLLDNFEWAYGWWPKFGLIAVDRQHGMKRTIRPSARWFADKLSKLR